MGYQDTVEIEKVENGYIVTYGRHKEVFISIEEAFTEILKTLDGGAYPWKFNKRVRVEEVNLPCA